MEKDKRVGKRHKVGHGKFSAPKHRFHRRGALRH
ncbi:hypothetical protein DES46_108207 [Caldimonas thermodepolymerans]|jgi:hypothetical protein|uniref:Uncharacterized protein n=2 Tax=Caldimonas thermodepolymerans TaxID=215580 RepID=A0AA46DH75_9BURK|nr:hypothetical protein DES46_108207 [Caldimonas thermodepolymerans]TCP10105.1 hypothetical protein EV676_101691 [Caldimonas thermodepolymerans]